MTDTTQTNASPTTDPTGARDSGRIGVYLNPLISNIILRPTVGLAAGVAVSLVLYGVATVTGNTDVFPWWAAAILTALFTLLFMQNEQEPIVVPKVHVAILTFLGFRLPIYLTEGDHYWYGRLLGFGRSTDQLQNPTTGTDDGKVQGERQGFVFIGPRQLEIFARKEHDDEGLVLQVVASDFSEIFVKLTIVLWTINPLEWANSVDPILDAAERARSALRTIVSFFSGVDNAVLKTVFSGLLRGDKLLSAFTDKPVGVHPRGSVIQNRSGFPIFEIVDSDISEQDLARIEDKLRERIASEANPEMLPAVRDENGHLVIQVREVLDHIVTVMDRIGGHFAGASVSDITLSDEVNKQANVAAGEGFQRVGQVLSARTVAEVQQILATEAGATPENELALMAALAKDDKATIIYVPGADRLTRAAVAGASQIGGKR